MIRALLTRLRRWWRSRNARCILFHEVVEDGFWYRCLTCHPIRKRHALREKDAPAVPETLPLPFENGETETQENV